MRTDLNNLKTEEIMENLDLQKIKDQAEDIKKQIDGLDADRKHYKLQSEWHLLMIRLVTKYETLISML